MARLLQRLSEQHGAITQEYQSDLKLCAQKLVAGFDLSDSHLRGTLMRYAEQRTNSGADRPISLFHEYASVGNLPGPV